MNYNDIVLQNIHMGWIINNETNFNNTLYWIFCLNNGIKNKKNYA